MYTNKILQLWSQENQTCMTNPTIISGLDIPKSLRQQTTNLHTCYHLKKEYFNWRSLSQVLIGEPASVIFAFQDQDIYIVVPDPAVGHFSACRVKTIFKSMRQHCSEFWSSPLPCIHKLDLRSLVHVELTPWPHKHGNSTDERVLIHLTGSGY